MGRKLTSGEIISDLPKALINWYDFKTASKVLFISGGKVECETLYEVITGKSIKTVKVDLSKLTTINDHFDYIVAAGIIERSKDPHALFARLKELLKEQGKLLIGAENRLGIRYFCGDRDPFSGHVFDGLDGYIKVSGQRKKINGGRLYARSEYKNMIRQTGFKCRFYSVMPELVRPQMLIAEDYVPNEAIDVRIFPQYGNPETLFLEEEHLYEILIKNNMFHQMANAFLIECTVNGELSDIDQITVQGDRGRQEALATMLKYPEWVSKKPLYSEGEKKIDALLESEVYLRQHKIPIVDGKRRGDAYVVPYIKGQIATEYFRETLRSGRQAFIQELKKFQEMILSSSEHVPYEEVNWKRFEPWWERRKEDDPNINQWRDRAFGTDEDKENIGVILKRGYVDMVSINCFHTEKGFVFFDQEFFVEDFPANAIFIRTIDFIYRDSPDLEEIYPREDLLKYFRLYEYQNTWRGKGNAFLEKLRKEKELSEYHMLHRRDYQTMVLNRHRMDYSQEEYERLFGNIFKGIGSKKIYLFGSGKYSEQFIKQFGKYYKIVGIVDNNEDRWGESLLGIEIFSPDVLKNLKEPFKIFICIKFFENVLFQLKEMGISEISIYDPRIDYDRPLQQTCIPQNTVPKRYHVGYVAGVFDLFHIGHLNIFKRAKEQCDYLIVGVVSDEQVIKGKKTRPYIPFDDRLAIVQACKYVDEAVEIPVDKPDTEAAWHMYHFDVQFSGSDYADDPVWRAKKIFLQQHGADMVFFPYTKEISSTKLKKISKRLV